jgi:hypothetical protein
LVSTATTPDFPSGGVPCRQVVRDGRHLLVPDVAAALDRAIGALLELAP